MRIIEVSLEDVDLTEAKILVYFSEAKIQVVEVNTIIIIKVTITKVIMVYIITQAEISTEQ